MVLCNYFPGQFLFSISAGTTVRRPLMLSSRIGCYHQNQQHTCTEVKPTQWSVGNSKIEVKENKEDGGEKNIFHISYSSILLSEDDMLFIYRFTFLVY